MIIQTSYVINRYQSENESISLITLLSLTLTIISLVTSIVYFIVQITNIINKYNNGNSSMMQIAEYEITMTLACDIFKEQHGYINKTLQEEILKALRKCRNCKSWTHRRDVNLSLNVYYIENNIFTKHEIYCYFELILVCNNNNGDDTSDKLTNAINNEIGNNLSFVQMELIANIERRIHCQNIKITNVKIFDFHKRNQNNVILRQLTGKPIQQDIMLVNVASTSPRYGNHNGNGVNNNDKLSVQVEHLEGYRFELPKQPSEVDTNEAGIGEITRGLTDASEPEPQQTNSTTTCGQSKSKTKEGLARLDSLQI